MGELWKAYEQIAASVYQKYMESHLNITVQDLQAFSTERWLQYTFNDSSFIDQPAVVTSSQDISLGINLTTRHLLKISVDGGTPIELSVRGDIPNNSRLVDIVNKINKAFGFKLASGIYENTVVQLTSPTSGVNSKITIHPTSVPSANAAEFILGVADAELPRSFPDLPYVYALPYTKVASVPTLQDAIRPDNVTASLQEGADYVVKGGSQIAFKKTPPENLWATRTLVDQENPWNNFGFLMDIYLPNSVRYADVLQGLWYAFWTGPKPANVKTSLYLLFGLPVAQEAGTVTRVSSKKIRSPNGLLEDRTYIEIAGKSGTVRTVEVPSGLDAAVTKGQEIARFHPLTTGIDVFDKINSPGFIASQIGVTGIQGFLTESASRGPGDTDETKALRLLDEYCFLPQISVDAFVSPGINLENVKTFLDAIKPLNKTYLFQVIVGKFEDNVGLQDVCGQSLDIDLTSNIDSNETTDLQEATLSAYELTDNSGLRLDPTTILFEESVQIQVYSFSILTDSFTA